MKNLKRLIALVAVFALALTTIASAASFTDVAEDSAYYEAVEQLHKIGIIDGYTDGTFGAEKTVTRSEMAKLIAAMQGYAESAAGKAVTKFSDVPSTHWASGYIAAATGVAIDGRPDGTFAPEEEVKYEDAVKMIMATLGYTVVANANGGYPMGYVSAAIKEGVTKDVVKAAVGTPASRGTIAQLIYNAIDTPLVEQITWNLDGSGDFIKYDGESKYAGEGVEYKTLMTENLGIVKGEGVVLATNFYGLKVIETIDKEDDLTIDLSLEKDEDDNYKYVWGADLDEFDGENILAGESGAEAFIGKAVKFFAYQNKYDDWALLSVVANDTYNKTVTFPVVALDAAKTAAADGEAIYYYKDDAKTSTKLALDTENGYLVMFNNVLADDITALTGLDATSTGSATFIDNDKDAAYDVVVVEEAYSAVVDEIDEDVVVLMDGEIDTDDDNLVVKFVKDGEEIAIDALEKGDVLSIVASDCYLVADVMQNVVEGTLTSTKASETSVGGTAYKVDGKWYDSAIGALEDVRVGSDAKFYIDKFDRIVYVDATGVIAGNFAYIYGTYFEEAEEDSYESNEFTFQILTKDGVKEYKAASTFYIDGEKKEVKNADDMEAIELENVVVDIVFSGDTVKKIYTNEDEVFEALEGGVDGTYDAEDHEIGTVEFDEDTVVYFVEEEVEGSVIDKAASYVGTLADIEAGDEVAGEAYFTKSVKADANILVLYNASTGINQASGLAVITDVVEASNADEEDIYELEVLYNGDKVALTTTTDIAEIALAVGDIVKIKVNGNKVVTDLAVVSTLAKDRENGEAAADYLDGAYMDTLDEEDDESIVEGYAVKAKKTSKKIWLDVDDAAYNLNKFANIYVIDNTGRKLSISEGSASSFKIDEKFYKGADDTMGLEDGKIIEDKVDDTITTSDIEDYADYVIIRAYEGNDDVYEMVIVKGAAYTVVSE